MLGLYALIHKVRDEYTIFFDKKNVRRFKNKFVKNIIGWIKNDVKVLFENV